MAKNVLHKMSAPKIVQERTWRDEKIFIYFSPRGTGKFASHPVPGDWVVAALRKPVSVGQEVTWQAVGDCRKLELDLPEIFEEPRQIVVEGNSASATLKDDVAPGLYLYEAYCNGQLATGGSAPGLIVDP
ncbi:MAG: hypothetical protein JWN74_3445 [Acidobacteriaceae bacterium]|nr:hypothetical protein [Acidobacteriaceae bacterium]